MKEHDDTYQKRDILLAKIDTNLEHVVEWTKSHKIDDDAKFKEVDKKLTWGAIAILVMAAATGVVPQVLAYIK